jgi:hypothetical protein
MLEHWLADRIFELAMSDAAYVAGRNPGQLADDSLSTYMY